MELVIARDLRDRERSATVTSSYGRFRWRSRTGGPPRPPVEHRLRRSPRRVAILERLRESDRTQLEALSPGWSPERDSEMAPMLGRPSVDLVSQSPQNHTF